MTTVSFPDSEMIDLGRKAFNYENEGWEQIFDSNNLRLWRREREGAPGFYMFKILGTLDLKPHDYVEFYHDIDYWVSWDDHVEKAERFGEREERDGAVIDKVYWVLKYPFPLANREYIYQRITKYYKDEKFWVMCCKSIPDTEDRFPLNKRVRVDVFKNTVVLRENPEGKTEMSTEYYDDSKLHLPNWLLKWAAQKAMPKFFKKLNKKASSYKQRQAGKDESENSSSSSPLSSPERDAEESAL